MINQKPNIQKMVVCANVFIRKDGKYLLMKRSPEKKYAPNKIHPFGGKIDQDENPYGGAVREIKEEVGVEVSDFRFFASRSFIRSSGHHVVALSFIADYKSGEAMPLEDQDEVKWVEIGEMDSLLDDHWINVLKALKIADKIIK